MNQSLLDARGIVHIVCNKYAGIWHVTLYSSQIDRQIVVSRPTLAEAWAEAERRLLHIGASGHD